MIDVLGEILCLDAHCGHSSGSLGCYEGGIENHGDHASRKTLCLSLFPAGTLQRCRAIGTAVGVHENDEISAFRKQRLQDMLSKIGAIWIERWFLARAEDRVGIWHSADSRVTVFFEGLDKGLEELDQWPSPRANDDGGSHIFAQSWLKVLLQQRVSEYQ